MDPILPPEERKHRQAVPWRQIDDADTRNKAHNRAPLLIRELRTLIQIRYLLAIRPHPPSGALVVERNPVAGGKSI
jgi:hypothetical protein